MADGHFIKKTFFVELSETQYGQDSFDDVSYVFACEDDLAPEYRNYGILWGVIMLMD
jgi:hypothetical protein